MGSLLRLIKTLNKNNKSNNSDNSIETDEDKAYQKYLETLRDSELEYLIKCRLAEFDNSAEGKAYHLRISEMTEEELSIGIREKLKIG